MKILLFTVNKYLELKSEEDQLDCNLSTLESANYLNKELLKQIDALKDENHNVSWRGSIKIDINAW